MRALVALQLLATLAWFGCARASSSREQTEASAAAQRHFSFAILEDYDKGDDLADVRRDFASFRELGITTWRGSLGWDDYEPADGTFDFNWLHRFADAAAQDGITLRPYVAYTPQWASAGGSDRDVWNDPPASLDTWGAFVRAIATALSAHPNLLSLEIYNEENVRQWWDGTPAQYRAVLERAAHEIRATNPRLQVILGGMVYPDSSWLDQICGHQPTRLFDVLPFHAYPETWTPPDVDLEHYLGAGFEPGFVHAADEACGRLPIWINETGFATTEGISEEAQAAWWARAIATFASEPRIEALGIYEIKDLAPGREAIGGTPNYHLGLERADRTKKLAFSTVKMFAALLGAGGFTIRPPTIHPHEASAVGVFARGFLLGDRRQLLVTWSKRDTVTVDLLLPDSGRSAQERRLNGESVPFVGFDGTTLHDVELTPGAVRIFEVEP